MRNIIGNATLAGGSQVAAVVVGAATGSVAGAVAVLVVGLWWGISLLK
ncbi:MAG: hypothetical protein K8U57_23060 [Planctomycetes bacterium]|nr:hypothetical protein [Planctomycetota bacterium]